jgi:uncharacterized protein YndB with AHSA1/START domain
VIPRVLRLGVLVGAAAWLAERNLEIAALGRAPSPVRTSVVVHAPIERTWSEVADIPGQTRWMRDMKRVTVETPGPVRVGTKGVALVRILGVATDDPVTITEFEPPHRFGLRHEGRFAGAGLITLVASEDGAATTITWEETIIPPVFPRLGSLVLRPILRRVFQADLERLRAIVEA